MSKNKARMVPGETFNGSFGITEKNTGLSQRETLEGIIINLSTCLKVKEIHKVSGSTGAVFYAPQELSLKSHHRMKYQSASNTILELSKKLLARTPSK